MSVPSAALQRLAAAHGVPDLTGAPPGAALAQGTTLLFFTGDPARHKEVDDLAVILPELARAFPGRFRLATIDPDRDRAAAQHFHVAVRPTLVLVHDGKAVGSIPRIRDWSDYLGQLRAMLDSIAAPAPTTAPAEG